MRREDEARRDPSLNGARREAPRTWIDERKKLEEEERSSLPQLPLAKAQTVLVDKFEDEGIELFALDCRSPRPAVPGSECRPDAGGRRLLGPRQRIDKLGP